MIHPYQKIVSYEGDNFDDYLNSLYLLEIFREVIDEFGQQGNNVIKGIIKYIVYGYSVDSEMLNTTEDFAKVKKRIFKESMLPDSLWGEVAELKSDGVINTIQKWLQYQNDTNWVQYITFRDLRRQMLNYSLQELKKSSGEIDINAKMDAAKYSKELLEMMKDALQTFIQNNIKLKDSIKDFTQNSKGKSNVFGAEFFVQ